jgi:hypothetical protein
MKRYSQIQRCFKWLAMRRCREMKDEGYDGVQMEAEWVQCSGGVDKPYGIQLLSIYSAERVFVVPGCGNPSEVSTGLEVDPVRRELIRSL